MQIYRSIHPSVRPYRADDIGYLQFLCFLQPPVTDQAIFFHALPHGKGSGREPGWDDLQTQLSNQWSSSHAAQRLSPFTEALKLKK